jgi:hypothetical protein
MPETKKIIYDAKTDAALFAESLRAWAKLGFLRGFAGVRSEIIPGGKMTLPTAAFHRIATESLEEGAPDKVEIERRRLYISDVSTMLSEHQSFYIDQHYKGFILGHVVDIVVGLAVIAIMAGLFYTYGPFHPIPLALVGLLGVKLIFLFLSVRRMIKIAQNTFTSKAAMIRIPWNSEPIPTKRPDSELQESHAPRS